MFAPAIYAIMIVIWPCSKSATHSLVDRAV